MASRTTSTSTPPTPVRTPSGEGDRQHHGHRQVRYRQDRADQLPAEPGAEAPAVADDFLLRQGPGRGDLRPGVRRQLPGAGERPVDRVQSVPVRSQRGKRAVRSEEHTSELQSLMRISYAVFCLKKQNKNKPI